MSGAKKVPSDAAIIAGAIGAGFASIHRWPSDVLDRAEALESEKSARYETLNVTPAPTPATTTDLRRILDAIDKEREALGLPKAHRALQTSAADEYSVAEAIKYLGEAAVVLESVEAAAFITDRGDDESFQIQNFRAEVLMRKGNLRRSLDHPAWVAQKAKKAPAVVEKPQVLPEAPLPTCATWEAAKKRLRTRVAPKMALWFDQLGARESNGWVALIAKAEYVADYVGQHLLALIQEELPGAQLVFEESA